MPTANVTIRVLLGWIAVFACLTRFVALDQSPPGFFYDEATGASHSLCYQQTGRDLFGDRGLFVSVDFSGFQSTVFVAAGALWTSVFGTDAVGFRSLVAFIGLLTVLGVYYLALRLGRNQDLALWAAALGACLPWAFHFSRISWDAPLGVALLVWALVLSYRNSDGDEASGRPWLSWAGAGLLFTLASYTYSPMRLQSGIMLVLLPIVQWRGRLLMIAIFTLGNLSVLFNYTDAEFASRAQLLAINSEDPRNPYRDAGTLGLMFAYIAQVFDHLTPQFLLYSGDEIIRHSIQTHGMIDRVTLIGLLSGLAYTVFALLLRTVDNRRDPVLLWVAFLGIVAGITPAALTWDSVPHSLRALGTWPFFVILAGFGLTKVLRWPALKLLAGVAVVMLFAGYLNSYFRNYPRIAAPWFDAPYVAMIRNSGVFPDTYLPVVRAYYRMEVFGQSCDAVREDMEGSGR